MNFSHEDEPPLAYSSLLLENVSFGHQIPLTLGLGVPNTPLAVKLIHYLLGTALIFIGLVGAIGNGFVLYIFSK